MKVKEVNEKIQKAKEIIRIYNMLHNGENMNITYDMAFDVSVMLMDYVALLENAQVKMLYD